VHKTGFVFGKFYPAHLGHLELIRYASSLCEHLVVLVCGSTRETIAPATRLQWFDEHRGNGNIEFRAFLYDEDEYPNTSIASRDVSRKWAEVFRKLVPDATLLVTSESYGEYVAEYMGISHMPSDPPRFPQLVSATALRHDLAGQWHWLAPAARRFFQQTIILSGTESTGKTTLARMLAEKLDAALVPEAGRDIVPDSNHYTQAQLMEIAATHACNIESARASGAAVVVVDTDIYITQSYARFATGNYLAIPAWIYDCNQASLRLYLNADAPYHQDGTRFDEAQRNALDRCHRQTLREFRQPFLELAGSHENRLQQAEQAIQRLFAYSWRLPA
jgi:HTH-type transcriptional repressor of NAD biosynthesis genes